MFYNYLKVIIRNFISDGMYTFIIIFGFAIGLASIFVIGQYVYFELSFDGHVKDKERIYYTYLNWGPPSYVDGKCFPAVAPFMDANIPEVEMSVRLLNTTAYDGSTALLRREENGHLVFHSQVDNIFLADPAVLQFFSVRMKYGDAQMALKEPNSMVITQMLADKFFHNEDPINQTLKVGGFEWRVTGVAEDPAPNSTLQFNALCSMLFVKQQGWELDDAWKNGEFQTFTKLHPGADFNTVEKKINELAKPLRALEEQLKANLSLHLYPFDNFHFFKHKNSSTDTGIQFSGDKKLLGYLGILSILILVISIANYINLTTARALKRAKEVGLRKVNGARRKDLVLQFLIEFSFLNLISFLLAFTMAQILFPVFVRAIGSNATWVFWTNPIFWLAALLIFVFCTAASGIYPALILSDYGPSKVLKGNFIRSQSGTTVRKGLVLIQFSLSLMMIMSIYVIARQLFFMQDKDLGIAVDQVLVIRTNELDASMNRSDAYERLKGKIANKENIISISSSGSFPGSKTPRHMVFQLDSDEEKRPRPLLFNEIGENYFKTMGLKLIYGRDFIADPAGDSTHVVINETATRELGFDEPAAAIGARLIFPETGKKFEIIGVLKDFSLNLKDAVEGEIFHKHSFFSSTQTPANFFLIKLSTKDISVTLADIKNQWEQIFSKTPFDYFFLDNYFDTFYKEEKQFAGVFAFFSVIGILITCMGLFGLSLFDTNSRMKEIGIRKSLGASEGNIMWLFSKDYMKLVLMAGMAGIPLGVYLLNKWLSNYPQRIDLAADAVLFPLLIMSCVAIITVGYQTFKTASATPVKALRAE